MPDLLYNSYRIHKKEEFPNMNRMHHHLIRFLILLALILCILFAVLFYRTNVSPQPETAGKITAILNSENLFWQNIWEALREESETQQFSLSEYQVSSTESIADYLEIALLTGSDSIIFNPSTIHDTASQNFLEQAYEKGICLVSLDADYTEVPTIHLGIDNIADSEKIASYVMKHISEEKIIFLKYQNTHSSTLLTRMKTIQELLTAGGYGDRILELELVTGEIARQEMLIQYFTDFSDAAFVIGCGPQQTLAAAKAVSSLHAQERIRVLGFGESDEAIEFLKNGDIEAMLIQNNKQMGTLAIQYIKEYLEGNYPAPASVYVESSLYTSNTANSIFR